MIGLDDILNYPHIEEDINLNTDLVNIVEEEYNIQIMLETMNVIHCSNEITGNSIVFENVFTSVFKKIKDAILKILDFIKKCFKKIFDIILRRKKSSSWTWFKIDFMSIYAELQTANADKTFVHAHNIIVHSYDLVWEMMKKDFDNVITGLSSFMDTPSKPTLSFNIDVNKTLAFFKGIEENTTEAYNIYEHILQQIDELKPLERKDEYSIETSHFNDCVAHIKKSLESGESFRIIEKIAKQAEIIEQIFINGKSESQRWVGSNFKVTEYTKMVGEKLKLFAKAILKINVIRAKCASKLLQLIEKYTYTR